MSYIYYVVVQKMMIKHQHTLPFLLKLSKDTPAAENLGVAHSNDLGLQISFEKGILLMIQAADAFVTNNHKPSPFYANLFYTPSRALIDEIFFPA